MPAFLDLPREIRDQIYGLNLVHGSIPIGTTHPFLQISYGQIVHEPKDRYGLCYCEDCTANASSSVQPIIRREAKRTVRIARNGLIGTLKNTAGTCVNRLQESYGQPEVSDAGFAKNFRQELSIFDSQNLSIFLGNRQIYQEASEIFYSRNKFDFGWKDWRSLNPSGALNYSDSVIYSDSLKNVSGFLQDRSEHALENLKSIRFALSCFDQDEIPETYWYKSSEFTMVCETLAGKCKLIELNVGILETEQYAGPHPCLKQLTKLKNLQQLHIWMDGPCDMGDGAVEGALATIKILRSQSLADDKMNEDDIEVSYRHGLLPMVRVSTWKAERYDRF